MREETVTPKKAAGLLGVHEGTVRRYISKGVIQVEQYMKGGWIQIPISELVRIKPSLANSNGREHE